MPKPEQFEIACQNLGINTSSTIVVYDKLGVYASPRVWWMFKIMGHNNIAVLNGGFLDWIKCGCDTEKIRKHEFTKGDFKVAFNPKKVSYFDFVKPNLKVQNSLVIDVRSSDRFYSLVPETRVNLRSGNIPNSVNFPYQKVLENGKFKSNGELSKLFNEFKTDKPWVFSCGSGITACIVYLASELVLKNEKSVYDGSWTEWGQLEK